MAKRRVVRRKRQSAPATTELARPVYVIGIDPSSKKLACVVMSAKKSYVVYAEELPIAKDKYQPEHAWLAGQQIARMAGRLSVQHPGELLVYIERPVMVKASVLSMTVQAYVNGAVQAELVRKQIPVTLVSPSEWKKYVAENGNASKQAVADALERRWPDVFEHAKASQDLIDAAAIALYGIECCTSEGSR